MRLTKEDRIKIVRAHARKHGGKFEPAVFVDEVESVGESHPAYDEFDWNDSVAARKHRIWQARMFAQGIKVNFSVQQLGDNREMVIRETSAPLIFSPMQDRSEESGYLLFNEKNKSHIAELCDQAARDLNAWLTRYEYAMLHVGADVEAVKTLIVCLKSGSPEVTNPPPRVRRKSTVAHMSATI